MGICQGTYLAPPLEALANICIVLFLIQSTDRLVLAMGCLWIHIKKIKPVPQFEFPSSAADLEKGASAEYPMVLVQIPMCNEMEVRGIECIRCFLRRSSEALLLLQLLSQHHVARLAQSLDSNLRWKLAQFAFHQFVCSDEGDQITTRLVAALMEYYIGPDGRGIVDDISIKLREGCPSYYNELDYRFFQAVESLQELGCPLSNY